MDIIGESKLLVWVGLADLDHILRETKRRLCWYRYVEHSSGVIKCAQDVIKGTDSGSSLQSPLMTDAFGDL